METRYRYAYIYIWLSLCRSGNQALYEIMSHAPNSRPSNFCALVPKVLVLELLEYLHGVFFTWVFFSSLLLGLWKFFLDKIYISVFKPMLGSDFVSLVLLLDRHHQKKRPCVDRPIKNQTLSKSTSS